MKEVSEKEGVVVIKEVSEKEGVSWRCGLVTCA